MASYTNTRLTGSLNQGSLTYDAPYLVNDGSVDQYNPPSPKSVGGKVANNSIASMTLDLIPDPGFVWYINGPTTKSVGGNYPNTVNGTISNNIHPSSMSSVNSYTQSTKSVYGFAYSSGGTGGGSTDGSTSLPPRQLPLRYLPKRR